MAMATQNKTLDRRETASLIGSDKVEGTPVYRSNGDRVGQVERVMIDKLSGKVAYAVMSFKGAPKYSRHESWDWSDRARDKKVYDYYGVGAYWA